jgi:hypothetical protein
MIKVFYPRGGGGNWLSNLIWHLETANFSIPRVNVIFDGQPQCSIPFSHSFEVPDPTVGNQIVPYELSDQNAIFSCRYLFNHYINNAVKVKYRIHGIHAMTIQQQLFELSNGFKYYMTNEIYKKYYCNVIDLDYALIFQDPKQFADVLLEFLDSTKIKYTANNNYVLASIDYYRTTCANPVKQVNDWNSMLWLGACHAITILDQLPIEVISPDADLETIAHVLQPHAEHYKQRITPLMFEWNDEYTTR